MKRKLVICLVTAVCLLIGFSVGVLMFSAPNIQNRINGLEPVSIEPDGRGIYVAEDYVASIRIKGAVPSSVELTLYFEDGSIDVLTVETNKKNSDVYISVKREVHSFSLAGEGLSVELAELNPTKLNVHWFNLCMAILVPLAISLSVISTVCDWSAFKKDVFAMKRYKYLLYDLVMRDIKTKYRRSALGLMWSILNPLLMMLVLTAVFSQIIRVEVEGGFALFYLTGYLIFNFISESSGFSILSILHAAPLIKKVYVPKYVFPLEKTLFSLVNMVFSFIAFVIVFVIFLVMGEVRLHFTMLLFFVPIVYVFIFAFGLNLILSSLNVFFRDVGHLWNVFLTVWMYATPIIYPIEIVPAWLQSIIRFNPLYHYVTYFRNIMIYGTLPTLADNVICIAFSLVFLAVGVALFRKSQNKFILHI